MRNLAFEFAVRRVVFEHVGHVFGGNKWVYRTDRMTEQSTHSAGSRTIDANDLNALLESTSEDETTNAAESVDANFNIRTRHVYQKRSSECALRYERDEKNKRTKPARVRHL